MSKSGQIMSSPRGYNYFLPNPLPPVINWDLTLINALSDADRMLGNLAGEGQQLPNPHLLIRTFIAREAVLSSKIEGTRTTLNELLAVEAGAAITELGHGGLTSGKLLIILRRWIMGSRAYRSCHYRYA